MIVAQENISEDNTSPVPPSVQVAKFASDSHIAFTVQLELDAMAMQKKKIRIEG